MSAYNVCLPLWIIAEPKTKSIGCGTAESGEIHCWFFVTEELADKAIQSDANPAEYVVFSVSTIQNLRELLETASSAGCSHARIYTANSSPVVILIADLQIVIDRWSDSNN